MFAQFTNDPRFRNDGAPPTKKEAIAKLPRVKVSRFVQLSWRNWHLRWCSIGLGSMAKFCVTPGYQGE